MSASVIYQEKNQDSLTIQQPLAQKQNNQDDNTITETDSSATDTKNEEKITSKNNNPDKHTVRDTAYPLNQNDYMQVYGRQVGRFLTQYIMRRTQWLQTGITHRTLDDFRQQIGGDNLQNQIFLLEHPEELAPDAQMLIELRAYCDYQLVTQLKAEMLHLMNNKAFLDQLREELTALAKEEEKEAEKKKEVAEAEATQQQAEKREAQEISQSEARQALELSFKQAIVTSVIEYYLELSNQHVAIQDPEAILVKDKGALHKVFEYSLNAHQAVAHFYKTASAYIMQSSKTLCDGIMTSVRNLDSAQIWANLLGKQQCARWFAASTGGLERTLEQFMVESTHEKLVKDAVGNVRLVTQTFAGEESSSLLLALQPELREVTVALDAEAKNVTTDKAIRPELKLIYAANVAAKLKKLEERYKEATSAEQREEILAEAREVLSPEAMQTFLSEQTTIDAATKAAATKQGYLAKERRNMIDKGRETNKSALQTACDALGVSPDCSNAELKMARRAQLSQTLDNNDTRNSEVNDLYKLILDYRAKQQLIDERIARQERLASGEDIPEATDLSSLFESPLICKPHGERLSESTEHVATTTAAP